MKTIRCASAPRVASSGEVRPLCLFSGRAEARDFQVSTWSTGLTSLLTLACGERFAPGTLTLVEPPLTMHLQPRSRLPSPGASQESEIEPMQKPSDTTPEQAGQPQADPNDRLQTGPLTIVGGCGHVGLPLGLAFARKGYQVDLVDTCSERVDL